VVAGVRERGDRRAAAGWSPHLDCNRRWIADDRGNRELSAVRYQLREEVDERRDVLDEARALLRPAVGLRAVLVEWLIAREARERAAERLQRTEIRVRGIEERRVAHGAVVLVADDDHGERGVVAMERAVVRVRERATHPAMCCSKPQPFAPTRTSWPTAVAR